MSAERLRPIGLAAGGAAFLAMAWACGQLIGDCLDIAFHLGQRSSVHLLVTRMCQLKPPAFKYPYNVAYAVVFAGGLLLVLVALYVCALLRFVRDDERAPGEATKP
jgi:hypothetical protein